MGTDFPPMNRLGRGQKGVRLKRLLSTSFVTSPLLSQCERQRLRNDRDDDDDDDDDEQVTEKVNGKRKNGTLSSSLGIRLSRPVTG